MAVLCCAVLSSCEPTALQTEKGFALHYPAVSEIAPGTTLDVTPTWYGGKPTEFSIISVTHENVVIETEQFSINSETGSVRISTSETTPVGNYVIGVSCKVNGSVVKFPEAIALELMKAVPDGIVVEPAVITAKLSQLLSTPKDAVLPTAQISSDGSNHVMIKEYLVANVYVDGQLNNNCKSWFTISDKGVFSITPNNPDFEAGIYTFDLKLTTYISGKEDQKGIFKNALTLNVTSIPTTVTYSPALVKVENGLASKSSAPAYKGSRDGLKYAIKSVLPDNEVGITIDENTGVLTYPATDKAEVGDTYKVSLTVTNDFGTADFDDAFTFEVVAFLDPITQFSYNNIDENISGIAISNDVAVMDGAEVTYSFVNLPENLSGLELNPETGAVSTQKGVELPVGEHTVTVRAENAKGSKEASFTIKVIANPNYFTYVIWGNNLGEGGTALEPFKTYGNQFRIMHAKTSAEKEVIKINFADAKTDIPEGRPVKFESVKQYSGGISITASGQLQLYGDYQTDAQTPKLSGLVYGIIKVTVGEGEAAITRNIPIFLDRVGSDNGYRITYTPFAFRVNPKTGGTSVAPVITKLSDGSDASDVVSLDFQTNATYYNVGGPESHTNVTMLKSDTKDETFLVNPWKLYYNAIKKTYNRGAGNPMSYWLNYSANTLSATCAYIDPTRDFRIVVNPDKFKDADGVYGDGVVFMTMSFSPSGRDPQQQSTSDRFQVNRAFIWLDPAYTE